MKKFLIIFLLLTSSSAYSQSFSVGYRTGKADFKSMDFIIGRYNETRPSLVKQMERITAISGPLFGLEINIADMSLGLEIPVLKSTTVRAESSTSVRELYMKTSGFEVSLSYYNEVFRESMFHLYFGSGVSVDNTTPTVYTRTYDIGSSAPEYSEIKTGSGVMLGLSSFLTGRLDFNSFALTLQAKPFYKFSLSNPDFSSVNTAINPVTVSGDAADSQKQSMNYYGIDLKLGITVIIF